MDGLVILQMLMGGGGSFSAGGPGKGMHSRLCMLNSTFLSMFQKIKLTSCDNFLTLA
jgi:processing peptidase subunit alpha